LLILKDCRSGFSLSLRIFVTLNLIQRIYGRHLCRLARNLSRHEPQVQRRNFRAWSKSKTGSV
jgi:hypothetical protein